MEHPFFSIIVPVYNEENYLAECLDSCVNQDLSDEDWEVLCIDDGSTDKSPEILLDYARKYPGVIKAVLRPNEGVSAARNCALDLAKGEWVTFLDSDDFLMENSLSKIKTILIESLPDMLHTMRYNFFDALREDEVLKKEQGTLQSNWDKSGHYCTNVFFRRALIEEHHIRFPNGVRYGEDEYFVFDFYRFQKSELWVDNLFYFCRVHSASTMHKYPEDQLAKEISHSLIKSIHLLEERVKGEEEPYRSRTILYLFACRERLIATIATLPRRDAAVEWKLLEEEGVLDLHERFLGEKETPRRNKHPRRLYIRKRLRFLWKEKTLPRVAHPLRSAKNLFRRFSK